jgi:hypothetical protein
MEDTRSAYNILTGKREGKKHSESLGVERREILEWILGKWGSSGLDASGSGRYQNGNY